jgi:hypothetical protein
MSNPQYPHAAPPQHVIEECAELIFEISKAERFGWTNIKPGQGPNETNYERVFKEIEDVFIACVRLKHWIFTNYNPEDGR